MINIAPHIENWVPPGEAARRLGLSVERVRQLLALGRLRYVQTPLGRLVDPDHLDQVARDRQALQVVDEPPDEPAAEPVPAGRGRER